MTVTRNQFASFVLAFSVALGAQALPKYNPSRSGDYCRDELEDILREKYGAEIRVTGAQALGQGEHWMLWARTNLCKGVIAAQFMADKWTCKQSSYGVRARSLVAAYGADGECRDVLPTIYW